MFVFFQWSCSGSTRNQLFSQRKYWLFDEIVYGISGFLRKMLCAEIIYEIICSWSRLVDIIGFHTFWIIWLVCIGLDFLSNEIVFCRIYLQESGSWREGALPYIYIYIYYIIPYKILHSYPHRAAYIAARFAGLWIEVKVVDEAVHRAFSSGAVVNLRCKGACSSGEAP